MEPRLNQILKNKIIKKVQTKSDNDNGKKLDIIIKTQQATMLQYYRMRSQNDWWMMWLKAI